MTGFQSRLRLRACGDHRSNDEKYTNTRSCVRRCCLRKPRSRPSNIAQRKLLRCVQITSGAATLLSRDSMKWACLATRPKGAFYVFPCVGATGLTSRQFSLGLLESQKVAVVPGDAFGSSGEGFVRCCFATSFEKLRVATDRIEAFLRALLCRNAEMSGVNRAVVLAAGRGKRMRELTESVPKPMVRVRGKPVLQIIVEGLGQSGIKEVLIIVGYHKEVVREYFQDGARFGIQIRYAETNCSGWHRPSGQFGATILR